MRYRVKRWVQAGMVALSVMMVAPPLVASEDVVVYPVEGEFDEVKDLILEAITEQGLQVSGTLHISDMLNRTAGALGVEQAAYQQAESIEFCSAKISHIMTQADPRNLVVCPFTVAIYVLPTSPQTVQVAFSRPRILGGESGASQIVFEFLDGIARAATE